MPFRRIFYIRKLGYFNRHKLVIVLELLHLKMVARALRCHQGSIHAFSHSFVHSIICILKCYLFVYFFIRLFIIVYSVIHLFFPSLVYLFIRLFIHSLLLSFSHTFILSCFHSFDASLMTARCLESWFSITSILV